MKCAVIYVYMLLTVLLLESSQEVSAEGLSDALMQVWGFPLISLVIAIVRFVKQLGYILNPATYRSRNRRQLSVDDVTEVLDPQEVEKYIVAEFGARACVFERTCAKYAIRAQTKPRPHLDWPNVFSQYKRSSDQAKEFYLLSVFLGDIIASPQLCQQLGKRRSCDPANLHIPANKA